MKFVKISCEYDIGGEFCNGMETVVFVRGNLERDLLDIDDLVSDLVSRRTRMKPKELVGFYKWDFIEFDEIYK